MGSRTGLRIQIRFPDKGGFAAKVGADGASPSKFFEWRCRADYAFGAPFVLNGRDGAPPPSQDSGAKRRLCWM